MADEKTKNSPTTNGERSRPPDIDVRQLEPLQLEEPDAPGTPQGQPAPSATGRSATATQQPGTGGMYHEALPPRPPIDPDASEDMPPAFLRGKAPDCIFDRGRDLLHFHDGRMENVRSIQHCQNFAVYIMDHPDSRGLGVLPIQGGLKYADILARKRLEEQGELTPDSSLVVYQKRKGLGQEVLVLYQVVPKARHRALLRVQTQHPRGMAVFDTVSMLQGVIRRLPSRQVHAVGVRLQGALLLLVGKGRDIFLARRYTLLGDDEATLREHLFTIRQDLEALAGQLPGKVRQLRLIEPLLRDDLGTPAPPSLQDGEEPVELVRWPLESVRAGERTCWTSLPGVARGLPLSASLGARHERWLRPLELREKSIWAGVLLLALLCGGLAALLALRNHGIHKECLKLEERIARLGSETPALAALPPDSVAPFLSLAEYLSRARSTPSLAQVWNSVAQAKPRDVCVQALSLRFGKERLDVDLTAHASGNLAQVQHLEQTFVHGLEQAGFALTHRMLSLENELEGIFTLHLQLPLEGE